MTIHHGVENPENVQANRTPEQIQRELGNTRARIDDGLDELDHRLGTGEAIKEAAYHMRDSAAEFSSSVGRVIRDNPVPAFLIGAGAAWIAMSALSRTERGQDLRHRVGERARGVAHDASDRADGLRHHLATSAEPHAGLALLKVEFGEIMLLHKSDQAANLLDIEDVARRLGGTHGPRASPGGNRRSGSTIGHFLAGG